MIADKRMLPPLVMLLVAACSAPATRIAPTVIAPTPLATAQRAPQATNTAPVPAPSPTRQANNAPVASNLQLPTGFRAFVYADALNRPTSLAFGPEGRLYAPQQNGKIVALEDRTGRGENAREVASVSGVTLGIAFRPGTRDLYISTTGRVMLARGADDGSFAEPMVLAGDLPTGRHQNDHIAFTPDGRFFFIGIGSTCDACQERDPRSATIMRISADGSQKAVYARGLRNPFGVAIHPETGELFATDNGRDVPVSGVPDELNVIVENGNYGFPDCWGRGQGSRCEGTIPPIATLQEHSSANGLAFYTGSNFPAEYRGNAFIALWGGNVPIPTVGKRVERVILRRAGSNWQGEVSTFAAGFDHPLAVAVSPRDGALYVADHGSGKIYRIVWEGGNR